MITIILDTPQLVICVIINGVWAYSSEVLLPASLSSEVVGHKVVKFGPVYEV
eukprot:COSAG01_NODE_44657_length_416_cov_14.810726_1_plen_51_part_01